MALEQAFIEQMRTRLEEKKAKLEEELKRFAKPTEKEGNFETQFENIGDDEDDNAHEVSDYGNHLALEQTLEKKLKDVHDALDRIEAGTYGVCEESGKEISQKRLEAYPEARTCAKM